MIECRLPSPTTDDAMDASRRNRRLLGCFRAPIRDAGGFEGGHIVPDMNGGIDESHRQGCPGAFAEPKTEIEQRFEAEVIEHDCVAGLE